MLIFSCSDNPASRDKLWNLLFHQVHAPFSAQHMPLRARARARSTRRLATEPPQTPTGLADHFSSLSVSPRKSGDDAPRRSTRVVAPHAPPRPVQNNPRGRKRKRLTGQASAASTFQSTPAETHELPGREPECALLLEKLADALSTRQGCCICTTKHGGCSIT